MVGSFLSWIGGGFTRMAATGIAAGLFFIVVGVPPWEFVVELLAAPPFILTHWATRFALLILGLFLIAISLRFNVWSKRQQAINALAEDLSWAISRLLNCDPVPTTPAEINQWIRDYRDWNARVLAKLGNRSFFTRADEINFDRLGFVGSITLSGQQNYDWWLGQLKLKFERLREIINLVQLRRR